MNKTELIAAMAEKSGLSKTDAGAALDAFVDAVGEALKQDDGKVALVGFGTFAARTREARVGRNPKTGAELKIAASKNPTFKAGKALKDAIQ